MPTATYEYIGAATLGSAAASISVTGIPSTYTDLRIQLTILSGAYPQLRFNDDSSSVYYTTAYQSASTSGNPLQATSSGPNSFLYANSNGTANANYPSVYVYDVMQYANSEFKMVMINGTNDINPASLGGIQMERWAGIYNSLNAISSVVVYAASPDFAAGTNLQVYGIKKE